MRQGDMIIMGNKVSLRKLTEADTENIVRWRNSPSVRANFVYRADFTAEGHMKWFTDVIGTGKAVQFIITDLGSGIDVGSVYLRDIDPVNEKAEFGIFIGEDSARGKGLGTEATRLICDYGFSELGLHKIILRVFDYNKGAIASYRKAGFVEEAFFRDDVKIDGKYESMIFMAKFKD